MTILDWRIKHATKKVAKLRCEIFEVRGWNAAHYISKEEAEEYEKIVFYQLITVENKLRRLKKRRAKK